MAAILTEEQKRFTESKDDTGQISSEEPIKLVTDEMKRPKTAATQMFTDETLKEAEQKEERWKMASAGQLGGASIEQAKTWSGPDLKPIYTPLDIKDTDFNAIGHPGEYPFTRGHTPVHYQVDPVMMPMLYGMGTAEDTRKRYDFLRKVGMRMRVGKDEDVTPMVLALDLPSSTGLDPDDPRSRGRVGECGASLSTMDDYADLFDGIPLERALTTIIAFGNVIPQVAVHSAYVLEKRKEPLSNTFHTCVNLPYHQWYFDTAGWPPQIAMRLQTEVVKWCLKHSPNSYPINMDGYQIAEAGAPPALEVALGLANIIELMESCKKAGIKPDDVAERVWVHPHLSLKFYEEIAKLRASRRLWARIMKERYGCTSPKALAYKTIVGQSAGVEMPAVEVHNNIIRVTVMAMAGLLADIDGMGLSSFDEGLGTPSEEAAQVAVRTYQVLHFETDITKVTDPFGGSYFMESLTNTMEDEILNILQKMDDMGGYMKCWESGWIRAEIERHANERFGKIDRGEWPVAGLNKYRVEEVSQVEPFRRPPEAEAKAIERVKKYKAERDQEKTRKSLGDLRVAAERIVNHWPESCGELFEASVEAARAKATMGEIHNVFREVFGFGYFSD